MSRIIINLEDVYLTENCLNSDVVEFYSSLGAELLYYMVQVDPIDVDVCSLGDENIFRVLQGCHRSRALYEMRFKFLEVDCVNKKGEIVRLSNKSELVKIADVLMLNNARYERDYLLPLRKRAEGFYSQLGIGLDGLVGSLNSRRP